jgi:hypothetical protein
VEAALYAAVDKGLITYDLKERLTSQIRMNFSSKTKVAKKVNWENYNAFTGYITKYTDDEIYNLLEDPSDIVIDVYHAVLVIAKERELISKSDFDRLYEEGLKSARSDEELLKVEMNGFYRNMIDNEDEFTHEEIEDQKTVCWKCPTCKELINVELSVCWKCQTPKPDKIEYPATEKIKRELRTPKPLGPIAKGSLFILGSVFWIFLSFIRHPGRKDWFDSIDMAVVIGSTGLGIVLIIYGLIRKLINK